MNHVVDIKTIITDLYTSKMNRELATEIGQYVQECLKDLQEEEQKCRGLRDEVERCGKTIMNLQNVIRNYEEREQVEKAKQRKQKRRDTYTRQALVIAFGTTDIDESSDLFHAALGFMKGSQLKDQDGRGHLNDNEGDVLAEPERRCTDKGRKALLLQMVKHMYDGLIVRDIEQAYFETKRFSIVTLARVSDMNSTFTASAVGCIAQLEGGKRKGEIGLLCGESTLRRTMDLVHDQAVQLGFSVMPEGGKGRVWCWGDETGLLTKAINMYVKVIYHDTFCENITQKNPWIVPLTGDLARTSQRGTVVAVMGPKQSDIRLINQVRTGKTMCQSSGLYTPAVAGYATEAELMQYFHLMVRAFEQIEAQGYCVVNGYHWKVFIKVAVVADLSFLHKYVQRGGSSHSATCFCMLCGAFRNFRHQGYGGGCLKCRLKGCVYGPDGVQDCLHYDACTPEFLTWQGERYAELCELVPGIPLTALPAWTTVEELRHECIIRCVGKHASELDAISRKSGKGSFSGQDLTSWIFDYCRGGCTLSNDLDTGVMHCDFAIVRKCLLERKKAVRGNCDEHARRLEMQKILQLEEEYSKMTLCMRDQRFRSDHSSAQGVPVDRLIICILHCPMRTHEKVLSLLMQQACFNKTPKNSRPILDKIVVILRRVGKLPDTWTYKMDDTNKSHIAKIKMHFDQSKYIFTEEHLNELKDIIRLAIPLDRKLHPPLDNRGGWIMFMEQYVQCTSLMTVTREYTEADLLQLEKNCDETYRLLISHCGGLAAVTNYFHYIGSGHVVWMCRNFGNIWRYRNEGVEAFNKTLSKRCNMFNSAGNKGRVAKVEGGVQVQPFEVLGKWMARYVMWQLEFANNLFIGKGGVLGPTEICWDSTAACFIANDVIETIEIEDDGEEYICVSDDSDSDSDIDAPFTSEDLTLCEEASYEDAPYTNRKRRFNV